jgi:hypothetical protein
MPWSSNQQSGSFWQHTQQPRTWYEPGFLFLGLLTSRFKVLKNPSICFFSTISRK